MVIIVNKLQIVKYVIHKIYIVIKCQVIDSKHFNVINDNYVDDLDHNQFLRISYHVNLCERYGK